MLSLLFPFLLLPFALWRWPTLGVLVVFTGTVTVEQFGYEVGPRSGAITAKIPLFHSVVSGSGITPVEILLVIVMAIWVARSVKLRLPLLHPSPLRTSIAALCCLVVVYLVVGIGRGGEVKTALWEARPFLYLFAIFLLSSALLSTASAVRALLWILVLGSGVKAVYGVVIWLQIRTLQPRPEAVLAHEESFFFGLFVFLTIGLWIFRLPGRLRVTATVLLPVVLWADMCNSRRTAWAILLFGSAVLLLITYVRLPEQRRILAGLGLVSVVVSAIYLPAFWSHDGTLAQPARAIRSVVAPDARDEQSNQYRYIEDANLSLNIQGRHSTGTGYGIPIKYAIAIVDLSKSNSFISFVPHDGIFYVWMRLGVLGEIVLWLFLGNAILAACRLTRVADRQTALFGALVVCAVVAYVIMGNKDLGFAWFRMAFCMGALLGAVEARSRALRGAAGRTPQDVMANQAGDDADRALCVPV